MRSADPYPSLPGERHIMDSDWSHIFNLPRTQKWRVKLCRLAHETWSVFGEGCIWGELDDERNEYRLCVTDDDGTLLFSSAVAAPVAFQKQDLLLLWNGPDSCVHLPPDLAESDAEHAGQDEAAGGSGEDGLARIAIGFQAATGCACISEFVLYAAAQLDSSEEVPFAVQHPGSDAGFDGFAEVVEKPLVLPPLPTQLNLTIVLNTMNDLLASLLGREILIVYLNMKGYLDRLWDVFVEITKPVGAVRLTDSDTEADNDARANADMSVQASGHADSEGSAGNAGNAGNTNSGANSPAAHKDVNLEDVDDSSPFERIQMLWAVSDIVKQYFFLGDSFLIDSMTESQRFTRVLHMLEYDRSFGTRKANFEKFYRLHTGLKQVVEITDMPVIEKIQATFRLQLLRDVLVRSADDFTFHILRTLIYVNYSEILEKLQNSREFCDHLFGLFDGDGRLETKDDAIRFISEIMLASKSFPYSQLRMLYLTLVDSGLIRALSYGLAPERSYTVKMLSLEALSTLMDFDSSLILPFRESIVASIVTLASSEAPTPSTRAIQIETAELLKKMLADIPAETFEIFFAELQRVFNEPWPRATMLATMLPFLDILSRSFVYNPEATCELMQRYGIWQRIASVYRPQLQNEADHKHLDAQVSMALIRLVREAIQPPVMIPTYHATLQAHSILEHGILQALVARHVREFAVRPNANDAEQSSFLNLLYVIIEGRRNSASQQFKVLVNWMTNDGIADTRLLCERYASVAGLLPDIAVSVNQGDVLKRPPSRQQGVLGHHAQRPRLTLQQHRQIVDEVDDGDVFVLGPTNFSSQFRQDAQLHALHPLDDSPISINDKDDDKDEDKDEDKVKDVDDDKKHATHDEEGDNKGDVPNDENHSDVGRGVDGRDGMEDTLNKGETDRATHSDVGRQSLEEHFHDDGLSSVLARQLSPSPPPHPWWDARHSIENGELAEDVPLLRQSIVRSQR